MEIIVDLLKDRVEDFLDSKKARIKEFIKE